MGPKPKGKPYENLWVENLKLLKHSSRQQNLALARQVAMKLAQEFYSSLRAQGRILQFKCLAEYVSTGAK